MTSTKRVSKIYRAERVVSYVRLGIMVLPIAVCSKPIFLVVVPMARYPIVGGDVLYMM
jgi:hypothetical protein